MDNPLLIAVLAGLGGMIGWGSADFFAKKTVDIIGPIKTLVWGHTFGTITFALIALVQLLAGNSVPLPKGDAWVGLAGFGILQMIVYWLLYLAFEKGQLSVINPIFASFTGLVALVSVFGFNEQADAMTIVALIVILTGVILTNLDLSELRSKKINLILGLKEVLAATVLAAVWTLGWDRFISDQNSLSYSLWMYAFMTLAAIGLAIHMKETIRGIVASSWKFLVLIGVGEMLAYLTVSWGYSATKLTSIVALISGAFSIPTVVLAYLFLKERITATQIVAIAMIISGIIGVSLN